MTAGIVAELRAAGCVFAEEEAAVLAASAADPGELAALVARRVAGVPLEHVVGWAEFCGRRIVVADGVFVPRHRTEFLVELATGLAASAAAGRDAPPVVVDLCCGSGALGAVVAARLGAPGGVVAGGGVPPARPPAVPPVVLHAADVDAAAVRCARHNVEPVGGQVHEGDLFAALPGELRGRVDVLIANAPYVPTEEIALMPPEAREYEPLVALDGGADGLDVLRRVIAGAGAWLAPGGHLLIETSVRQAPALAAIAENHGLVERLEHSEDHEATVLIATRPVASPGAGPATAARRT